MLDKEKCDKLIKKAKSLNKAPTLSYNIIYNLQEKLVVTLPEDFKYIATHYHYEYISFFSFYHLNDEVIEETKFFREQDNLPHEYIILSQQDDVSFLLLKTISSEECQVIWCDYPDFFNLCDRMPMQYKQTIFNSFTDFFEFLLDEEEKMQKEDEELRLNAKD